MGNPTTEEATSVLVPVTRHQDGVDRATDAVSGFEPDRLLGILYDRSPDEWFRQVHDRLDVAATDVRIVSVGSEPRSVTDGEGPVVDAGRRFVTPIADRHDLTGIGIAVGEHLENWQGAGVRPAVLFDCLTALLQWVDRGHAVQYLQILTERIDRAGGVGVFLVSPATLDEETDEMLREVFDATLEEPDSTSGGDRSRDGPPPDRMMELLSEPQRRCVVRELVFDGEATVEELAERVAADLAAQSRDDALVRLYHVDLPKLANAGVLEYDEDAGRVEFGIPTDRVRPYLAMLDADVP